MTPEEQISILKVVLEDLASARDGLESFKGFPYDTIKENITDCRRELKSELLNLAEDEINTI